MKYFYTMLISAFFIAGAFSGKLVCAEKVQIKAISENAFIHLSEKDIDGSLIPSNGLLIRVSSGFILIDTPWDDEQTAYLLDAVKTKFEADIVLAVITHAHDDRIGGINELNKRGIRTVSSKKTAEFAVKAGFPAPEALAKIDTTLTVGGTDIQLFFPGAGHTRDNITVFFPQDNVLFAGCFLKSLAYGSIGNVIDADVEAWPKSVAKLKTKYPTPKIIVPGHGPDGDGAIYAHTIKIIEDYLKKNAKRK